MNSTLLCIVVCHFKVMLCTIHLVHVYAHIILVMTTLTQNWKHLELQTLLLSPKEMIIENVKMKLPLYTFWIARTHICVNLPCFSLVHYFVLAWPYLIILVHVDLRYHPNMMLHACLLAYPLLVCSYKIKMFSKLDSACARFFKPGNCFLIVYYCTMQLWIHAW